MISKRIRVAAGVIRRGNEVLIAQRPSDKHQGGLWEFPGGKVESGEAVQAALVRELNEELGITATAMRPLIQVSHDYPDKQICLDVWEVSAFQGEPEGKEGQPLRWVGVNELHQFTFPAANYPIVTAAQLPDCYAISPDSRDPELLLAWAKEKILQGRKLLLLRAPQLTTEVYLELAKEVSGICTSYKNGWCKNSGDEEKECSNKLPSNNPHRKSRHENKDFESENDFGLLPQLMLHGDPVLLEQLPAVAGIHSPARFLQQLETRPLPENKWWAVSTHNQQELAQAEQLGADFATLSPVQKTATHPDSDALGWERFSELVAQATIPVFALGGLAESDKERAWQAGGQGVAAIRGM